MAAEALLTGRIPPGGDELRSLAELVADVRTTFGPGLPLRRDGALADLLTTGLVTDKGDLPATAGSNAHGPARGQAAGLPKWRRRRMVPSLLGTLAGKMAVGFAAACAALGGVAVAGALPDPAQSAVAHAAHAVGLQLPDPNEHATSHGRGEPLPPASGDHAGVDAPPSSPSTTEPPAGDPEVGHPEVDHPEGETTPPTTEPEGETTPPTTEPETDHGHDGATPSTTVPSPEGGSPDGAGSSGGSEGH